MANNKLSAATLDFSAAIVNLVQSLVSSNETVMSDSLGKCGTMIGAYIYESQFAPTDEAYLSKLQSALDAANQTGYWLELLFRTDYFTDVEFREWAEDCDAIRGMIIAEIEGDEE